MENKTFVLNWSALPVPDAAAIHLLRMCKAAAGTLLFSSLTRTQNVFSHETVVSASVVNGSPKPPTHFVIPQRLPALPGWDTRQAEDGTFYAVIEQAGGAVNALALLKWQQAAAAVPARYPYDSFHRPRFVKRGGGAASGAITTVVNTRHLAVFVEKAGRFDTYTPLCDASEGILLQDADGFSLFYKEEIPGAVRGSDIAPGRLHYQRLGIDFKPLGASMKPLGDTTIFEFDVDRNGRDKVIFATTRAGYILALGAVAVAASPWSVYSETSHTPPLTRPCLSAEEHAVRLAALEAEQTPQARVLVGAANIPS